MGWTRGIVLLVVLHVIPIIAIVRGTTAVDWLTCGAFYLMFVVGGGAGLHRYFAHRAFRTSRGFQLVLALLGSTAFSEPIGFAGKHRLHHRHSDTPEDVHAPREGFWYCWFGSLFERPERAAEARGMVPDLVRYPELVWLHRWYYAPTLVLGAVTWLVGGFSLFAVGFVLSRVLILHAVSAVNFFCHRRGRRPFDTHDASTNNALVALLTFGEGWHNNHHRFPSSARAGLRRWEIDPVYYLIRLFAAVGLVWAVREVRSEHFGRGASSPRRAGEDAGEEAPGLRASRSGYSPPRWM